MLNYTGDLSYDLFRHKFVYEGDFEIQWNGIPKESLDKLVQLWLYPQYIKDGTLVIKDANHEYTLLQLVIGDEDPVEIIDQFISQYNKEEENPKQGQFRQYSNNLYVVTAVEEDGTDNFITIAYKIRSGYMTVRSFDIILSKNVISAYRIHKDFVDPLMDILSMYYRSNEYDGDVFHNGCMKLANEYSSTNSNTDNEDITESDSFVGLNPDIKSNLDSLHNFERIKKDLSNKVEPPSLNVVHDLSVNPTTTKEDIDNYIKSTTARKAQILSKLSVGTDIFPSDTSISQRSKEYDEDFDIFKKKLEDFSDFWNKENKFGDEYKSISNDNKLYEYSDSSSDNEDKEDNELTLEEVKSNKLREYIKHVIAIGEDNDYDKDFLKHLINITKLSAINSIKNDLLDSLDNQASNIGNDDEDDTEDK